MTLADDWDVKHQFNNQPKKKKKKKKKNKKKKKKLKKKTNTNKQKKKKLCALSRLINGISGNSCEMFLLSPCAAFSYNRLFPRIQSVKWRDQDEVSADLARMYFMCVKRAKVAYYCIAFTLPIHNHVSENTYM